MKAAQHLSKKNIVIVGAGYTGIATFASFAHRLAEQKNYHITLIEEHDYTGGVAYGANAREEHVMNVPIHLMNAFPPGFAPDGILELLDWLNQDSEASAWLGKYTNSHTWQRSDFCPRTLYGRYLQHVLQRTLKLYPDLELTLLMNTSVVDISIDQHQVRQVHYSNTEQSASIPADYVLLATGYSGFNFKQLPQAKSFFEKQQADRYFAGLWDDGVQDRLAKIPPDSDVFIIGAGLSAMDPMRTLYYQSAFKGIMHIISRRGVLHAPTRDDKHDTSSTYSEPRLGDLDTLATGNKSYALEVHVAALQQLDQDGAKQAYYYGKSIDDVSYHFTEKHVKYILQILRESPDIPDKHRLAAYREIATHLRKFGYSDVFVTGMPYVNGKIISELAAKKQFMMRAGSVVDIQAAPNSQKIEVIVSTTPNRGPAKSQKVVVDYVVNSLGFHMNFSRNTHPLFQQLLAKQHIEPHVFGFGLRVDDMGRLYGKDGKIIQGFILLGPALSAQKYQDYGNTLSATRSIVFLREYVQGLVSGLLVELGLDPTGHGYTPKTRIETVVEHLSNLQKKLHQDLHHWYESFILVDDEEQAKLVTNMQRVVSDYFIALDEDLMTGNLTVSSKFMSLNNTRLNAQGETTLVAEQLAAKNVSIKGNATTGMHAEQANVELNLSSKVHIDTADKLKATVVAPSGGQLSYVPDPLLVTSSIRLQRHYKKHMRREMILINLKPTQFTLTDFILPTVLFPIREKSDRRTIFSLLQHATWQASSAPIATSSWAQLIQTLPHGENLLIEGEAGTGKTMGIKAFLLTADSSQAYLLFPAIELIEYAKTVANLNLIDVIYYFYANEFDHDHQKVVLFVESYEKNLVVIVDGLDEALNTDAEHYNKVFRLIINLGKSSTKLVVTSRVNAYPDGIVSLFSHRAINLGFDWLQIQGYLTTFFDKMGVVLSKDFNNLRTQTLNYIRYSKEILQLVAQPYHLEVICNLAIVKHQNGEQLTNMTITELYREMLAEIFFKASENTDQVIKDHRPVWQREQTQKLMDDLESIAKADIHMEDAPKLDSERELIRNTGLFDESEKGFRFNHQLMRDFILGESILRRLDFHPFLSKKYNPDEAGFFEMKTLSKYPHLTRFIGQSIVGNQAHITELFRLIVEYGRLDTTRIYRYLRYSTELLVLLAAGGYPPLAEQVSDLAHFSIWAIQSSNAAMILYAAGVSFAGRNLANGCFDRAILPSASFAGSDLTNATFIESELSGADFSYANLTGTYFHKVKTGRRPTATIAWPLNQDGSVKFHILSATVSADQRTLFLLCNDPDFQHSHDEVRRSVVRVRTYSLVTHAFLQVLEPLDVLQEQTSSLFTITLNKAQSHLLMQFGKRLVALSLTTYKKHSHVKAESITFFDRADVQAIRAIGEQQFLCATTDSLFVVDPNSMSISESPTVTFLRHKISSMYVFNGGSVALLTSKNTLEVWCYAEQVIHFQYSIRLCQDNTLFMRDIVYADKNFLYVTDHNAKLVQIIVPVSGAAKVHYVGTKFQRGTTRQFATIPHQLGGAYVATGQRVFEVSRVTNSTIAPEPSTMLPSQPILLAPLTGYKNRIIDVLVVFENGEINYINNLPKKNYSLKGVSHFIPLVDKLMHETSREATVDSRGDLAITTKDQRYVFIYRPRDRYRTNGVPGVIYAIDRQTNTTNQLTVTNQFGPKMHLSDDDQRLFTNRPQSTLWKVNYEGPFVTLTTLKRDSTRPLAHQANVGRNMSSQIYNRCIALYRSLNLYTSCLVKPEHIKQYFGINSKPKLLTELARPPLLDEPTFHSKHLAFAPSDLPPLVNESSYLPSIHVELFNSGPRFYNLEDWFNAWHMEFQGKDYSTGEAIFKFTAFKDGIETGTVQFLQRPEVCRYANGDFNLAQPEGVFKELIPKIDPTLVTLPCDAKPGYWLDVLAPNVVRGMRNGAVRATTNTLINLAQTRSNLSKSQCHILGNSGYLLLTCAVSLLVDDCSLIETAGMAAMSTFMIGTNYLMSKIEQRVECGSLTQYAVKGVRLFSTAGLFAYQCATTRPDFVAAQVAAATAVERVGTWLGRFLG